MSKTRYLIEDLQRGIKLAFEVPETHVANAIGYLLGQGLAHQRFSDEIVQKFQTLATPQGWSLCVELLKVRLELRAGKLHPKRDVGNFYKLLEGRKC
jgi:hypothetical protein